MTLREIVNEELELKENIEIRSPNELKLTNLVKNNSSKNPRSYRFIKLNNKFLNMSKLQNGDKYNEILQCFENIDENNINSYLFRSTGSLLNNIKEILINKNKEISLKINGQNNKTGNLNFDKLKNKIIELIDCKENEIKENIDKFVDCPFDKENDREHFDKFSHKGIEVIFFRKKNVGEKLTFNGKNILSFRGNVDNIYKYIDNYIKNGFSFGSKANQNGEKAENDFHNSPSKLNISGTNNKISKEDFDLKKFNPDKIFSFRFGLGATSSKQEEGVNSADIGYSFKNKIVLIEVKYRDQNSSEKQFKKDILDKNTKNLNKTKVSRQKQLGLIINFLNPQLNNQKPNVYTLGAFREGLPKCIDNSQSGFTKITLDNSLKEYFNEQSNIMNIKSYNNNEISSKEVKRILTLSDLEEQLIKPILKDINTVVTVTGKISKEQWNNLNNQKSVVTEGIFDNVKKGVTAAKMALALGTSKLDPNYKSSQNYQQNIKIERQYNQNQEIFKAAKKSLDSIINFCKKYGLNNSLQEANRLLPLLNKKMAASVETKYFNY